MYLLLELRSPWNVRMVENDTGGELRLGGRRLREIDTSGREGLFLGFYDWLRTWRGEPVGVRVLFHDGRDDVIEAIRRSNTGFWVSESIFEFLFRSVERSDVDLEGAGEQEFGPSRCFCDESGAAAALLFDASEISDEHGAWDVEV